MRHRIALVVGGLAASATLAVALVAAGFGPASSAALVSSVAAPVTTPRTQVDTVYIPAPVAPQTITVHRTVTGSGESDDNEAGGDD